MSFLNQLNNNRLLSGVIVNRNFSNIGFSSFDYTRHWDDHYSFKDIQIGDFIFKNLEIRISPNGIFITFLSDDTAFYDTPILFFETEGITVEQEPFIDKETEVKEFRRKLGAFTICGKLARISVLKSETYGSMIKVSFIN